MRQSDAELDAIYAKTAGACTYCGFAIDRKRLLDSPAPDGAGAWVVDYWVPRTSMGEEAEERANLWPVCVRCSLEKAARNGSEYVLSRRSENRPLHPRVDDFLDDVGDWFSRRVLGELGLEFPPRPGTGRLNGSE